jgi:hypothetical protein
MGFLYQAERIPGSHPAPDLPIPADRIPASRQTANMAAMAFMPTDDKRGL